MTVHFVAQYLPAVAGLAVEALTGYVIATGSRRPSQSGSLGGLDLWVLTRPNRTVPFGNATNLGRNVNSGFVDRRPAVSADGSYLLFMSDRSGGSGFFDLWQATRPA